MKKSASTGVANIVAATVATNILVFMTVSFWIVDFCSLGKERAFAHLGSAVALGGRSEFHFTVNRRGRDFCNLLRAGDSASRLAAVK
jgi:hypothetical protein